MINMKIEQEELKLSMNGEDDVIIDELTYAIIGIMKALENTGKKSAQENLAVLLLCLCAENEKLNFC